MWHRVGEAAGLEFTGTIHDARFFDVNGQSHLLIKLAVDENTVIRVDLGPREPLARLGLCDGARVTIWGRRAELSGRQVFIAERICSGQQVVAIRPWLVERPIRVEGRVVATRLVQFRGRPHVLARLQTRSGRIVMVDLGRAWALRQSWLGLGRNVQVLARPVYVHQHRVLVGTRLYVGDESHWLHPDWPGRMAATAPPAEAGVGLTAPGVYGNVRPEPVAIQTDSVRGQIIATDTYTIGGQLHLLATVRLHSQRTMTFDLGDARLINPDQVRSGVDVQVVTSPTDAGNGQVVRVIGLYAKNRYYPLAQQEALELE
jgi:hypothetical protein